MTVPLTLMLLTPRPGQGQPFVCASGLSWHEAPILARSTDGHRFEAKKPGLDGGFLRFGVWSGKL
jgi:hypothetical protein